MKDPALREQSSFGRENTPAGAPPPGGRLHFPAGPFIGPNIGPMLGPGARGQ
jgi:hypothetical protein